MKLNKNNMKRTKTNKWTCLMIEQRVTRNV